MSGRLIRGNFLSSINGELRLTVSFVDIVLIDLCDILVCVVPSGQLALGVIERSID